MQIRKMLAACCLFLLGTGHGFGQSEWTVTATEIDPSNYYGVTVANGMVGLVSSPEPLKIKDVVLNGAFDTYGRGRVSNILKGFNFANVNLLLTDPKTGEITGANSGTVSNYEQSLDMKNAVLTYRFKVSDQAEVTYKVMALRHLPFCSMVDIEVKALKEVAIKPQMMIEAPEILRDVKNHYSVVTRPHVSIPLLTSVASSPTGKHIVAASSTFMFEGHAPQLNHLDWHYDQHWVEFDHALKAGESFNFSIVGTAVTTEHFPDPHNEAERLTIYAFLEGKERLLRRHQSAWEELWEGDIVIDGDEDVQKEVRYALYHLYSFARAGTAYSMSPMGLSGLGYNGHAFWDTELWMYPPLLMLQPEIARSLLEYRYERLELAKINAFSHGYKGAMFPWESADEGQEATPVWALTGPFEHHITGCVGWAFWKYYQVTRDKYWLRARGYPVLENVADFWVSRVERDGKGNLNINNVVGADEYAENVDNNAFTNGVAITSLQYADQAAEVLSAQGNEDWLETADRIPILTFNDGVTREYSTYQDTIIKQSDVNLLSYPLKIVTREDRIRKDLTFYEERMDPAGPAMGLANLAVIYARLGEPDKAYELFLKSFKPNKVPPFGVIAETAGGTNPYFATGAGGMLQVVLAGFGGLDITDDGIVQLKTKLPKKWKSLTIKGVGTEKETFRVR